MAPALTLTATEIPVPLHLEPTQCCLCETENATLVGVGKDFEYWTSDATFLAMQCRTCGLIYLNPRPAVEEFNRIYPANYHTLEFSAAQFGLVYQARRWLEARRLLGWWRSLPDKAQILDVGCGAGFHLSVLREFGKQTWTLEGVDPNARAVEIGRCSGLHLQQGTLDTVKLSPDTYDLVLLIQTIEHVTEPPALLQQIRSLLRPGGRLVVVTDNTDTLDFRLFKRRYWGGYDFPRQWYLFNRRTIRLLAEKTGFEIEQLTTQASPVNWTYSIHNALVDWQAPPWLINRFSLKATVALTFFMAFDTLHQLFGKGAALTAILRRPHL
jgi:SAM-dependent methyltransferase